MQPPWMDDDYYLEDRKRKEELKSRYGEDWHVEYEPLMAYIQHQRDKSKRRARRAVRLIDLALNDTTRIMLLFFCVFCVVITWILLIGNQP